MANDLLLLRCRGCGKATRLLSTMGGPWVVDSPTIETWTESHLTEKCHGDHLYLYADSYRHFDTVKEKEYWETNRKVEALTKA